MRSCSDETFCNLESKEQVRRGRLWSSRCLALHDLAHQSIRKCPCLVPYGSIGQRFEKSLWRQIPASLLKQAAGKTGGGTTMRRSVFLTSCVLVLEVETGLKGNYPEGTLTDSLPSLRMLFTCDGIV